MSARFTNNGQGTPATSPTGGASTYYDEGAGRWGIPYKWLVICAVVFGVFMAILDSTIVNITLPKLEAVFGADLNEIQWVITAYLLSLAVSIPLAGYMADRFGIKRIYLSALGLFIIGSALCGLAWSTGSIVFFRIIQGLGGGALLPLGTAMIFAAFPPQQRGLASAFLGIPIVLAPAIGPTLGGYLVQYADWRLIFYINVPVGILGLIVSWTVLRERRSPEPGRFDLPGFMLSTIGFSTLLYGISDASTDGWGSVRVIAFVCVGIIALISFVFVELRTHRPLLDVRLFKDWSYTSGSIVTWTVQMSLFGSLFLLPIYLQTLRGLNAFQAGLWLLPSALITLIFQPIGGILVDRIGAKWIILVGTVALVITTFSLSRLNLFTSFWSFQMVLVIRNIALSFTLQPSNVVALYNVPRQLLPRATSLYNVMRQLMVSFGTALLATFVQNREPVHYARLAEQVTVFSPAAYFVAGLTEAFQAQGYDPTNAHLAALQVLSLQLQGQATMNAFDDAFLLTVGIAILGVIASFFLPSPARVRRSQERVQGVPMQTEETRGSRAAALIE